MVGHSNGGAEATYNAVATGKNCIIFNPMSVNLAAYGLDDSTYEGRMWVYIVEGEILNSIFGWVSSPIRGAEVIALPNQHKTPWYILDPAGRVWFNIYNSIQNHLMGSVISALKEYYSPAASASVPPAPKPTPTPVPGARPTLPG